MEKGLALINCSIICIEENRIKKDMAILVEFTDAGGVFGKICAMDDFEIPSGFRKIDLDGKYVMPGLINAHVHLFSSGGPVKSMPGARAQKLIFTAVNTRIGKNALKRKMKSRLDAMLTSGVTTVRCVGDFLYQDVVLRNQIESGNLPGPRMKVSGHMISATGGHGAPFLSLAADTPDEGIALVRKFAGEGVNLIKICVTGGVSDAKRLGDAGKVQMEPEVVSAICDEAHKFGLPVAAHVQSSEGLKIALTAGVDTIEHGCVLDDELIALFKENPRSLKGYSYLVPTIYAALPGMIDKGITGFSDITCKNSTMVFEGMLHGLKQALDAGIKIGFGTDAGMPYVTHYNTWRELYYLCKYGDISPCQALCFATINNAELMGIESTTGSIDVGKSADFIVLYSDPLQDIETLKSPLMVALRGNLIEHLHFRKDNKVESALDSIT